MPIYSLDNNNSGGSFWIGPQEIVKLREAGWYTPPRKVGQWVPIGDADNYFGTGCTYEELHDLRVVRESAQAAIEEFERITGQDFFAEGCNCCGAPFTLSELTDEGSSKWDADKRWGGGYVEHKPQRPF